MKTLIVGSGAQGRVVADLLKAEGQLEIEDQSQKYAHIEFRDDDQSKWGQRINGILVGGSIDSILEASKDSPDEMRVIIAVGNPILRQKLAAKLDSESIPFFNAIHVTAAVAHSCIRGVDNTILAQAVVNTGVRLGRHILVNNGAVVEHDGVVEDFVTVSPGVQIGGRVHLGRGCFVGTGAIVLPRLKIGANTVVAAGSIVTRDLPEGVLAMGAPARVVGAIDSSFDWQRLL